MVGHYLSLISDTIDRPNLVAQLRGCGLGELSGMSDKEIISLLTVVSPADFAELMSFPDLSRRSLRKPPFRPQPFGAPSEPFGERRVRKKAVLAF